MESKEEEEEEEDEREEKLRVDDTGTPQIPVSFQKYIWDAAATTPPPSIITQ